MSMTPKEFEFNAANFREWLEDDDCREVAESVLEVAQLTAERDAHKEWHEKCDRALKETLAERDRYREALEQTQIYLDHFMKKAWREKQDREAAEDERDRYRAVNAEATITELRAIIEAQDEKWEVEVAAAEATAKRYREALVACTEFGCDVGCHKCGDPGDTCLDRYPTDVSQWCQSCIAVAALALDGES